MKKYLLLLCSTLLISCNTNPDPDIPQDQGVRTLTGRLSQAEADEGSEAKVMLLVNGERQAAQLDTKGRQFVLSQIPKGGRTLFVDLGDGPLPLRFPKDDSSAVYASLMPDVSRLSGSEPSFDLGLLTLDASGEFYLAANNPLTVLDTDQDGLSDFTDLDLDGDDLLNLEDPSPWGDDYLDWDWLSDTWSDWDMDGDGVADWSDEDWGGEDYWSMDDLIGWEQCAIDDDACWASLCLDDELGCIDDEDYCLAFPEDPSCEDGVDCVTDPLNPACMGDLCVEDPTNPACDEYCDEYPDDPVCDFLP